MTVEDVDPAARKDPLTRMLSVNVGGYTGYIANQIPGSGAVAMREDGMPILYANQSRRP